MYIFIVRGDADFRNDAGSARVRWDQGTRKTAKYQAADDCAKRSSRKSQWERGASESL